MKDRIKRRVGIELSHYHELGTNMKKMLLSWGLLIMAWPMVVTFINAYLWQQGDGVSRLVVYNTLFFVGLPIGYWFNKYILAKMHVLRVYWLGAVLQGLSALLVVFLPTGSLANLAILGWIFGLGGGLYWANKVYLTLRLTRGKNRIYYNSMETVVDLVINIALPAIIGWFLVVGEIKGWYTKELAYQVMLGVGMLLLFWSGQVLQSSKVDDFVVKRVFLRKVSKEWGWVRKYAVLSNVWSGLGFFFPSILVLTYLGQEGVLGLMESVVAAVSALVIYAVGRKTKLGSAWKVVLIGNLVMMLAALILSGGTATAVVIFMMLSAMGSSLGSNAAYPVVMEMMDSQEGSDDPGKQYRYVFEVELFYNIGRLLGVGLFLVMIWSGGLSWGLRYTMIVAGLARLGAAYYQRQLGRVVSKNNN